MLLVVVVVGRPLAAAGAVAAGEAAAAAACGWVGGHSFVKRGRAYGIQVSMLKGNTAWLSSVVRLLLLLFVVSCSFIIHTYIYIYIHICIYIYTYTHTAHDTPQTELGRTNTHVVAGGDQGPVVVEPRHGEGHADERRGGARPAGFVWVGGVGVGLKVWGGSG